MGARKGFSSPSFDEVAHDISGLFYCVDLVRAGMCLYVLVVGEVSSLVDGVMCVAINFEGSASKCLFYSHVSTRL